jgi:acyl carrier protein
MPRGSVIEQRIARFIDEQLTPDDTPVDGDENLLTGGRLDSVGIMRLIAHLESTLRVAIPPSDLIPQNFRTVRIMAAYLEGIGARAPRGE